MRAAAYRFCIAALARLSPETACRLGAAAGALAFALGIRRRVVAENLLRTLGLRGTRRRRCAWQSYRHLGASFIDMWTLDRERLPVELMNPLHVQRCLQDPRGLVIATVHIGSWEAGGAAVSVRSATPMLAYAKAQRDRAMDACVQAQRESLHMQIIFARRGGAHDMLAVLRALRGGSTLALVADQMPTGDEGCPGHFLGVPTQLHLGPAVLSRLTRSQLVPAICLRVAPGRFRLFLGRAIPPGTDDAATAQRCMDVLSASIAAFPSQYFWHHRRFKRVVTVPPRSGEPWKQGLSLLARAAP